MGGSSVTSSGTKKKKGVFKSIAKGLSIKKKKKQPDDESVIDVALDRNGGGSTSVASAPPPPRKSAAPRSVSFGEPETIPESPGAESRTSGASSPIAKPIQVVLLLMDPSSRRFELLQLEFDSNKALVSDVLRQIQCSATETTLRDMKYIGVCDQMGMEMIASMKLSKFCGGDDIVLAIPSGMTGSDTSKLAGPILGDPKVENMLAPCGAKVKIQKKGQPPAGGTKLTKIAEEGTSSRKSKKAPSPTKKGKSSDKATKKASSSILPTAVLGIIISSLLFMTLQRHFTITKPLQSGDSLLPGQWKSQCGIFELVPEGSFGNLLMNKLAPLCDLSSSSMLELGKDGTLRYFTKQGADGERQERWSVASKHTNEQCSAEGSDEEEQCHDMVATFVEDGNSWFVELGGARTSLNKDVIRDFTTKS